MFQTNTTKAMGAAGTAVAVCEIAAVVPTGKAHAQIIDVVSAGHRVVAEFSGIAPEIKVQTVFRFSQTRCVDAVATVLGDIRVQAVLRKADVVAGAVLRSDDVGIFMYMHTAKIAQPLLKF